jgi:hypothetical protein
MVRPLAHRSSVVALFACAFAAPLMVMGPAAAADRAEGEAAVSAVVACLDIADPAQRVVCYDAAAGRLRDAVAVAKSAESKPVEGAAAPDDGTISLFGVTFWGDPSQPENFGADRMEKPASVKATEVTEISALVTRLVRDADGKATLTLDNGQVWKQEDSSSLRLGECPAKCGVRIAKGFLGSYNLSLIDGSNKVFKVRRLQ